MNRVLPILFNPDMVRAILDGRKTVTRRLVKVSPYYPHFYKLHNNSDGKITGTKNRLFAGFYKDEQIFYIDGEKHIDAVYYQAPYQPGDTLYVRETWCGWYLPHGEWAYRYKATEPNGNRVPTGPEYDDEFAEKPWRPSIHMPREAARIWLKVTDVRVERLQDITEDGAEKEGIRAYTKDDKLYKYAVTDDWWIDYHRKHKKQFYGTFWQDMPKTPKEAFMYLWNSTIKKSDLDRYGWDANPLVWRIEFERCEKPEEV